jgi:hypothetical protein
VRTPGKYAGSLSDVNFDLDNTGNFSVIIANRAYSLQTANVTLIEVNQNAGSITPALIEPGANATFNCIFNWSSLVGQNVTVRAHLMYNSTEVQLTYNLIVPYLKITSASFIDLPPETPYVNLTIRNSEFSKTNATIVQVVIMNGTTSLLTIGSSGYQVNIGSEIEIACSWNWGQIVGRNITVVMTTAGGFQVSATFKVE